MARRSDNRLKERRAAAVQPALPRSRPLADKVSRPINRSPLMAARARLAAVDALPGVLYRKPEKPKAKPLTLAADEPARKAVHRKAPAKPVLDTRKPEKPLSMDRTQNCKERPNSTKRTGSGPSRDFIPYCGRKS